MVLWHLDRIGAAECRPSQRRGDDIYLHWLRMLLAVAAHGFICRYFQVGQLRSHATVSGLEMLAKNRHKLFSLDAIGNGHFTWERAVIGRRWATTPIGTIGDPKW